MMKSRYMASAVLALTLVFAGCTGAPSETYEERHDREQQELIEDLREQGFDVQEIEIPEEMYGLDKGTYEVHFTNDEGEDVDCTANVIKTTHGATNIILQCK